MIGPGLAYACLGLLYAAVALLAVGERSDGARWRRGLFWGLFALSLLFGDRLGDFANGLLLLALAAVSGARGLSRAPPAETASALAMGGVPAPAWRLLLPALLVPFLTLAAAALLPRLKLDGAPIIAARDAAPTALALAVVLALAVAAALLRPRLLEPVRAAGRLSDAVGSIALLPQTLAALGAVFALAGVGREIGSLVSGVLPEGGRLAAVCVYTFGMALFTVLMGNAFAAFPVMAGAVGVPILIQKLGADPATIGAVGMLSGFCGTLVTPMAANFNLVPAALLGLKDRHAVIRVQAPTAGLLLLANTLLIYLFAFRS